MQFLSREDEQRVNMPSRPQRISSLGMVQMTVTVPHLQKGSALSSLRFAQGQALSEAKELCAGRERPFAALRVTRAGRERPFASLRVTRWDGSNGSGLFFTTEPCLNK